MRCWPGASSSTNRTVAAALAGDRARHQPPRAPRAGRTPARRRARRPPARRPGIEVESRWTRPRHGRCPGHSPERRGDDLDDARHGPGRGAAAVRRVRRVFSAAPGSTVVLARIVRRCRRAQARAGASTSQRNKRPIATMPAAGEIRPAATPGPWSSAERIAQRPGGGRPGPWAGRRDGGAGLRGGVRRRTVRHAVRLARPRAMPRTPKTRGASAAIALLDADARGVTFCGGRQHRRPPDLGPRRPLVPVPGVYGTPSGFRWRSLSDVNEAWPDPALIVMHSDGVAVGRGGDLRKAPRGCSSAILPSSRPG